MTLRAEDRVCAKIRRRKHEALKELQGVQVDKV